MNKLFTDFFRPFSTGQITTMMTYAMEMETYGLTAADVVAACTEYMAHLRVEMESLPVPPGVNRAMPTKKLTHRQTAPSAQPPTTVCPDCGGVVQISLVNVSKCTAIGGDWRTSLMCVNPACRYTELSIKTIADWSAR